MSEIGIAIAELAKITLQIYFAQMAIANKTEEEIDLIFQEQREQFFLRNPSKLNKVPNHS